MNTTFNTKTAITIKGMIRERQVHNLEETRSTCNSYWRYLLTLGRLSAEKHGWACFVLLVLLSNVKEWSLEDERDGWTIFATGGTKLTIASNLHLCVRGKRLSVSSGLSIRLILHFWMASKKLRVDLEQYSIVGSIWDL